MEHTKQTWFSDSNLCVQFSYCAQRPFVTVYARTSFELIQAKTSAVTEVTFHMHQSHYSCINTLKKVAELFVNF